MISTLSKKIATLTALFVLGFAPILAPAVGAQNQIRDGVCQGTNLQFGESSDDCSADTEEGVSNVNGAITQIVDILSVLVGIIAVIMIIFGGFRYITSGGDSSKVGSAKNTIIYAIVGLVIVAFAQFIVKFVLGSLTGDGGE